MSKFQDRSQGKAPTQRQLKVGEELRHALSSMFMRGELFHADLNNASITVSEVRVSPDLKNATAYVLPLGGKNQEAILTALNDLQSAIRHLLSRRVHLRFLPRLSFRLDHSFENASRINSLLQSSHVAQDIAKQGDEPQQ